MDKKDFPELFDESQQQETSDLELLRTRKEVVELKAKLQKYEQILKDNDLMDGVEPVVSDVEQICVREIQRYNELSQKGAGLTLEDNKILDLLHKNLLLARGKAVAPEAKKTKKEEQKDVATLLKLAEGKE